MSTDDWPPIDANSAPIKYVSKNTLDAKWAAYIDTRRWGHDRLTREGIPSLWIYEEKCWWAVHPADLL